MRSGSLQGRAVVVDLQGLPACARVGGWPFSHILPPGLYAYWTAFRDVRVEVIDARNVRFEHADLRLIAQSALAERVLESPKFSSNARVCCSWTVTTRQPCRPDVYAFWKSMATVKFGAGGPARGDVRRCCGQDIMTLDKVTLRLNAVVTYRIVDVRAAVSLWMTCADAVPRGAACTAGGRRRARARSAADRQGRRRQRAGRNGPPPARSSSASS